MLSISPDFSPNRGQRYERFLKQTNFTVRDFVLNDIFLIFAAVLYKTRMNGDQLNDYHKKVNAEMRAKVAYWQEHPQSRKESLRRLRLLREQRLANLSNW
jgi:hypothetical protein